MNIFLLLFLTRRIDFVFPLHEDFWENKLLFSLRYNTNPQHNHLDIFWFNIDSNRSGGFGSYLYAMSETIAKQATEANDALNIKNPQPGWIICFLLLVSFVGLFALVPMRKVETSLPSVCFIYNMQKYPCNSCLNGIIGRRLWLWTTSWHTRVALQLLTLSMDSTHHMVLRLRSK